MTPTTLTRETALEDLRRVALGLGTDAPAVARLLERISALDFPEQLRDLLTEIGARALLASAAEQATEARP